MTIVAILARHSFATVTVNFCLLAVPIGLGKFGVVEHFMHDGGIAGGIGDLCGVTSVARVPRVGLFLQRWS